MPWDEVFSGRRKASPGTQPASESSRATFYQYATPCSAGSSFHPASWEPKAHHLVPRKQTLPFLKSPPTKADPVSPYGSGFNSRGYPFLHQAEAQPPGLPCRSPSSRPASHSPLPPAPSPESRRLRGTSPERRILPAEGRGGRERRCA